MGLPLQLHCHCSSSGISRVTGVHGLKSSPQSGHAEVVQRKVLCERMQLGGRQHQRSRSWAPVAKVLSTGLSLTAAVPVPVLLPAVYVHVRAGFAAGALREVQNLQKMQVLDK